MQTVLMEVAQSWFHRGLGCCSGPSDCMALVFSWIIQPEHLRYIIFTKCHDRNRRMCVPFSFVHWQRTHPVASRCLSCFSALTSATSSLLAGTHAFSLGAKRSQLQPAHGWQTVLTLLCLKINTVTFAKGFATHQPRLPKWPTFELAFIFKTPKHKCPLHVSWKPNPGQTGNAVDTMSIWNSASEDSWLEFLQQSQKLQ